MMWAQKEADLFNYSPDSLMTICLNYLVAHKNIMIKTETWERHYKLKDNIILPAAISEKLLETFQKYERLTDAILHLFRDQSKTRLRSVILRNAHVTDEALSWLMEHKPYVLDLVQCEYLSHNALDIINKNSDNLLALNIGPMTSILSREDTVYRQKGYVIFGPNIKKLIIQRKGLTISPLLLLRPLTQLTHLDLSECTSGVCIWALNDIKHLVSFILHNVQWVIDIIDWICTLTSLKHLDISQVNEKYGKYSLPNEVLTKLVTSLPKLTSLDISGTNLAGTGAATVASVSDSSSSRCDIPGLVSRVNKPLRFLGLYGSFHGACKRHDIPASYITGDANEEQILIAAVVYIDRPTVLTRVLNDLYYLFRYDSNANIIRALAVVLDAMNKHVAEKHIQISGSATLFYIVKGKEKPEISIGIRRRIIRALLDGMEAHLGDDTMMRNGCLTLCQFKIPNDVLFEYKRVVLILLHGVTDVNQEGFVQRIAIYLLNSLACQVDGKQKQYLGNLGAISKMLNLIADRLSRRLYDDVLEVAWSTMWNVTDETPQNCLKFLENRGMDFFLACLNCFPNREELLRNMMGLLGNVAEVAILRSRLMNNVFLSVFYELLNSASDGIEVSYNAAGVLAHMASDGPEAWIVDVPSRDAVLRRMTSAVNGWNLQVERNINYRSFEPILGLLKVYHTPQCQHWATWALANLTSVYPEKYCELVEAEGGLDLLKAIIQVDGPPERAQQLARIVVNNCENWAVQKLTQETPSD